MLNRTRHSLLPMLLLACGIAAQTEPIAAGNAAVDLVVPPPRLSSRYGPIPAAPGSRFLIVATEWRNRIPLAVIDGRAMPTPYLVPDLAQQVFLVVDGVVAPLAGPAIGRPGVLPMKKFTVADPYVPTRGNLVFAVPEQPRTATLLFADENHGAFTVPLLDAAATPKPTVGPVRNELVEASVASVRSVAPAATAPPASAGSALETIAVDLRVTALRRRHEQAKCAALIDWPAFGDCVQLLVDGDGVAPLQTTLPETSRFLPELGTGGELRFVVPTQRQSLTLLLLCPELKTPSGPLRPPPLQLQLAGELTPPPNPAPLLAFDDAFFQVSLLAWAVQPTAAGDQLVATFRIVAKTKGYEVFQPRAQFALIDPTGRQQPPDAAAAIALAGPERLLLPPASSRRFALAWPMTKGPLRLGYQSADPSGSRVLPLPDASNAPTTPGTSAPGPTTPPTAAAGDAVTPIPTPTTPPAAPTAGASERKQPPAAGNTKPATTAVDDRPRVPIRSERTPKGIEGVGLTAEQVNRCIDRGCAALWERMHGGRVDRYTVTAQHHVLGALALVHAGFHKKNSDFDGAVRRLLGRTEPWDGTYVAGLLGMLVEAYGDPAFLPLLRINTEWLLNTQLADGSFGYTQPTTKNLPPFYTPLPTAPRAVLRCESSVDVQALLATPLARHKDMPAHPGGGDNSVTQYALLGLDAAARLGLQVPEQVWRDALQLTRKRQCRGGGWDYNSANASGYGSMTAAALCAIALASHYLGQPIDGDVQIEQGLGWIDPRFTVRENPAATYNEHYWLYSVERLGRLLDTEFIGQHEWYPAGARYLVDSQRADGMWQTKGEYDELATPFALLFLTRATPKLRPEVAAGPGELVTAALQPPGRKLYIVLDASGSMLEEVDGRTKFEIAREAMAALIQGLPDTTQVALRVYGHRKRAIEDGADEDSEQVLPMGTLDRARFAKVLAGLRPRGKTPLAYSLEQSLGQVTGGTATEPLTLLLLTDGGEDTKARRDPVAVAAKLAKIPHLNFRVVGFDIAREAWTKQLAAMTTAGNGRYLSALRTQSLLETLRLAALDVPSAWTLFDKAGKEAGRGKFGDSLALPPGDYTLRTQRGEELLEVEVVIRPAGRSRVTFDPTVQ